MIAIIIFSSIACKVRFFYFFSFLDSSMVMEHLEEENRVKNLLGFSYGGNSWLCNTKIHKWTC
jgi:hypothetical protein